MAINSKAINRRIKSVVNTKKITKAMELVSASKMRKAVQAVLASRPYAKMAWSLATRLEAKGEEAHPLMREPEEGGRVLAVLVTSDRGLCGGFNAQVLKTAAELVRSRGIEKVDFIAVGRRGEQWIRRRNLPLKAAFGDVVAGGAPAAAKIRPIARMLRNGFTDGTYGEIVVVYTDFVSSILQKPRVKTLLPLRKDSELGEVRGHHEAGANEKMTGEYLFEPNPRGVLDALLPRIAEAQLYQAVLESLASEHSARMLAMKNATDAASDMIDDLRLTFNQARQAGITQEIAEISAGRAALANA
ncbi:MAG: ATP synthase F1 subunit gamma [Patescibacteria group bacterium]|nr:MAG: ATP synthase F1 subunit gamma [Patescibacteria group bacterium]